MRRGQNEEVELNLQMISLGSWKIKILRRFRKEGMISRGARVFNQHRGEQEGEMLGIVSIRTGLSMVDKDFAEVAIIEIGR